MRKTALFFGIFFLFVITANAQKVVAEKAITIKAGGYTWFDYDFTETTTLKGRFRATGGKNDIEVYIMDEDNFENWRNGNQSRSYYFSGRVTVANFNVSLPKGKYHLIFSNKWAAITPKAVTVWFYE
jgi:hypothetical protein